MTQARVAPPFPVESSRCEECGYPLLGLDTSQNCPECGRPLWQSHPDHRIGLPWQIQMSPKSYLRTVLAITFRPKASFSDLSVRQSPWLGRAFFLITTSLGAFACVLLILALTPIHALWAWGGTMILFKSVLAMTYIEVLGVWLFSRRRKVPMTFNKAEQVCLFASLAWWPGMLLIAVWWALLDQNIPQAFWKKTLSQNLGSWDWQGTLVLWAIVLAMSQLGFELLTWAGTKSARYADDSIPTNMSERKSGA